MSIPSEKHTQQLYLYVDGVLVTYYVAGSDGIVTLSQRTETTVLSASALDHNIQQIVEWHQSWHKAIAAYVREYPRTIYKETVEKTSNSVEVRLQRDSQWVIRATWQKSTNEATFLPRPLLNLSMPDFMCFLASLLRFQTEIKNFA